MKLTLSRFSIRKQIVLGYLPVFLLLGLLGYSSLQEFVVFRENFRSLQTVTHESTVFLEIERDMLELRRNILVYSNTGYRGVIKKIEFLQLQLEEDFTQLSANISDDKEIESRFLRMLEHYYSFKEDLFEAQTRRGEISTLYKNKIDPIHIDMDAILGELELNNGAKEDFEGAYSIAVIRQKLLSLQYQVHGIRRVHKASSVREARGYIEDIKISVDTLQSNKGDRAKLNAGEFKKAAQFHLYLQDYKKAFSTIVKLNRTYIHMLNVVLPGQLAEIDRLNKEIEVLADERSSVLSEEIEANISNSKQKFIVLCAIAGGVGFLSSLVIARGIAKPVKKMAETLSGLAGGKVDIDIPGQERGDEVGKMAIAAHEFKLMAHRLENQTSELEEFAYRTSHDLRSPLVSSISLLDMANRAMEKEDYKKANRSIELVKKSLVQLDNLVKDILELTRTKNAEENIREIDVNAVFEETMQKMAHLDGFDRLSVTSEFDINGEFHSLKSRFTLVFENLVSNAIKYQDPSKDDSFISIKCVSHENNVVLDVTDNGLGIPEKQREHLFSMFKRFHPKVSFGSGLGLYMMRKSTDVLGGNIEYIATGSGSTFRLTVPKDRRVT